MRQWKRVISFLLILCMAMAMFAGCSKEGDDGKNPSNGDDKNIEDNKNPEDDKDADVKEEALYKKLDPNISGELSIMCWSGDSIYYTDIGKQDWKPEDIVSQNVAAIYAMAKEFNKMYPNVKINLWAKADDPNGNDTLWAQEMENFKAEHGKYPDIYASNDLVGDVSKGMVADLSVFKDDPLYKSFNESVMQTMQ